MAGLVELPGALTLLQAAVALVAFGFLPGYLWLFYDRGFKGFASIAEGVETVAVSVVSSFLVLAVAGIVLAFTAGVSLLSLLAVYAVVFGALVWRKKIVSA